MTVVRPESEAPETEAEIVQRAVSLLRDRLPTAWTIRQMTSSDRAVDALIEVRDVEGTSTTLVVEAKRSVEGRNVAHVKDQLEQFTNRIAGSRGLVAARYLSPPVRARLDQAGLSYIDATGNIRVQLDSPGLFVSDRGSDSDPWRGAGRPRGTLKGDPAAKLVRAIADFSGVWTVRELVDISKASTGSTYRVVEFLEREGLATRSDDGRVTVSDWEQVLRRWSNDYSFVGSNKVTRWIAPRGLPDLVERIGSIEAPSTYAVTGTLAAAQRAAYAPARLASIYVADSDAAADAWDLRPADTGANVLLAVPKFDVVFDRSMRDKQSGIMFAAPSQVVVDLMTGPGRNPSEAEELLDWMKRNEQSWRN